MITDRRKALISSALRGKADWLGVCDHQGTAATWGQLIAPPRGQHAFGPHKLLKSSQNSFLVCEIF